MNKVFLSYGGKCWFSEEHVEFCKQNICDCCIKRFVCYTDRELLMLKEKLNNKDNVIRGQYFYHQEEVVDDIMYKI
jgi:hypothetical protein